MKKYQVVRIRKETYEMLLELQLKILHKTKEKKKIIDLIHEAIEMYYKNI